MTEDQPNPPQPPPTLNYRDFATASLIVQRDADPRRLFLLLLPGAVCISAILGSWVIEATYPQGDSRNFGGPMCVVATAPLGLVFGVMAIRETFRPRSLGALRRALAWSAVLAGGPWLLFWMIIRFGWLKHM
jgi:hypothetical protein